MSAISLKSITGITSITTPAGVDNQLTLHNNNTTEAVKLDVAGNLHFHNHLNITGVSTASNFKTGTSNLHNTGLNVQDLDVDGHTNLDNVSIAGVTTVANTLRYNDNVYASFGTDGDASLWHDNSHLRFNNGTGNFNIQSNDFQITDSSNTTLRFRVDADGPTYVRYNGLDRLITSNAGVSFPRDIDVDGHTNLDNVSIAGVTTVSNKTQVNSLGVGIIPDDHMHLHISSANPRILIKSTGTNSAKIFFGDSSSNDPGVIEYDHTNNRMRFGTNNTEDRFIIDSSGRVIIGHNATDNRDGFNSALQVTGTGGDDTSITVGRWTAGPQPPHLVFSKSRNGTIGSHTAVQTGDELGAIQFLGDDGTRYLQGAHIKAEASTPIADYDMATDLVFGTNYGTTSPTERLRINNAGSVSIGNNPTVHSDTIFHVEKSSGETNVKFEGNDTMGARLSLHNNSTSGSAKNQIDFCDAGGQSTSSIQGFNTDQTNNLGELVIATRSAQGTPPEERLRIASDGTAKFKGNIEVDTGSAATIDFGDITTAYGRLYADNSNGVLIGSKSNHNLTLRTNNQERIKIANNSAATSIGGSNVFNAMLTVQGDISGELLRLKATEGTNRLMISGTDSNGVEVNLYDDAGGQRGILGVSSGSNEFFIKSPNSSSQLKFYTNDGYGTVWRAQLTKHGIFRAHGFSRSSGTNSQGYNNLRSGYQGDDLSLGPSALYYVGHRTSPSSSNYSAHEVTMYTSGHWGQYTQLIIYAKQHYYHTGYRVWHVDNGGGITLKEDYGGGNMNNTNVTSGGQVTVGSGTHGGQNVYKHQLTFTNNGTYVQTKWFVGWIGSGGAGHIGNSKTVAQADAHFATNGGGLHFVNVAHESLQASAYYQY